MRRPAYYKRLVEMLQACEMRTLDTLVIFTGSNAWAEAKRGVASGWRFVVCPEDTPPGRLNWSNGELAALDMHPDDAIVIVCGDESIERTRKLVTALMMEWASVVYVLYDNCVDGPDVYRRGAA